MQIQLPSILERNVFHDFSLKSPLSSRALRIGAAILPFFAMYKPFCRPLSLGFGSLRCIVALQNIYSCKNKKNPSPWLHASFATAALAGTVCKHPLGLVITTLHDLILDASSLLSSICDSDVQQAISSLLCTTHDLLYGALFFGGGSLIAASALSTQFLIAIHRCYVQLQKEGNNFEGICHLILTFVRAHMAIRGWQEIIISREIEKAKIEERPYLPIANRAQQFFAHLGHKINNLARWTASEIIQRLAPLKENAVVKPLWPLFFTTPLALAGFLISTPCYLMASYVGTGRFVWTYPSSSSSSLNSRIQVMFQNICGQDPWSLLSGKQSRPLEPGPDGKSRVDALLEQIIKEKPDVYLGQEFEDVGVTERIAETLSAHGYVSLRDIGAHEPFLNHSGLFIACRIPIQSASFHPFRPEDVSGVMKWCDRGVLAIDVKIENNQLVRFVNIHLNPGDEKDPISHASRLAQLQKYAAALAGQGPALIAGDGNLNTATLTEEEKELIGLSPLVNFLEGEVTCDDGKVQEKIDVAIPVNLHLSDLKITPGHSDHHQVSLQLTIPSEAWPKSG